MITNTKGCLPVDLILCFTFDCRVTMDGSGTPALLTRNGAVERHSGRGRLFIFYCSAGDFVQMYAVCYT